MEHEKLFAQVTDLIRSYLVKCNDRTEKVVDFKTPAELQKLIDYTLRTEGESDDVIFQYFQTLLHYSIHTASPRFYNQLFSGIDEVGMMGAFVAVATNTTMCTFEMAPAYSLMEAEVLHKLRLLVGWEDGDGLFAPGGSVSNLYGLMLARFNQFPQIKTEGVRELPQMVLLASEQCHYSVQKSAFIMGIGMRNVITIPCNDCGQMITKDLESKITQVKAKGACPIAVVATAATTVLGAFDPIDEIADVCARHSVWLHVDGAVGCSALVSRTHRHKLNGIHRADSVTWNPHKSLGVPLQCSAFLTRHKDVLMACNATQASYIFQQDKVNYDVSYDTGDKSIQCGRLNDALKLWLMWKQKGTAGLEKQIDRALQLSMYLTRRISEREGFQLVIQEPEYTNVSFWYIPPALRHLSDGEERNERLDRVAPVIKGRMVECGSTMISYQPLGGRPNFFRMVLAAPRATETDMDFLLDEIERLGHDLDL